MVARKEKVDLFPGIYICMYYYVLLNYYCSFICLFAHGHRDEVVGGHFVFVKEDLYCDGARFCKGFEQVDVCSAKQ